LRLEARIAGPLTHKNIVQILDIYEEYGFLVEEFVEGKDLESLIKEHIAKGTWFTIEEAVSIIKQILEAINYLHTFNPPRIHGDIKPANILIQGDKTVKLTDFGVGKILLEETRENYEEGRRLGSLNYQAPEVFRGHPRDKQTDLFSIGVVAYLLLTQQHPFLHPSGLVSSSILIKSRKFRPPPPNKYNKKISEKLNSIVLKLIEKNRKKRYKNAACVLRDLKDVLEKELERRWEKRIKEKGYIKIIPEV